jgi:2-alkyl-3-oxoalkanoate reductase
VIVAVTGGSGFVGGAIVRALVARGHEVHTYGQREASALRTPVPNYTAWNLTHGRRPVPHADVVVHCAALVGDWGDESWYQAANVTGTQVVLESFPTARVVYVSTSSVYSDHQPPGPIAESASTGACRYSPYGRTKAQAERLVLARDGGVVLRPHLVYGPGDTTLLPRVLEARRLGLLPVPGAGTNILSVTHIDNFVQAVLAACDREGVAGAFNIADAEVAPRDALLRVVLARAGVSPRLLHIPHAVAWTTATMMERLWPTRVPPRGPRLTRYVIHQLTSDHVLDISRARAELDYQPLHTFRSTSA